MDFRIIDKSREGDINLKNEPFPLFARVIPTYDGKKWDYTVRNFPENEVTEMCFPDENYSFDEMNETHTFVGAYDGERCAGLAILADDWFKYMYLDDLKVSSLYRRQGVGAGLMKKSMEIAKSKGYSGIYTIVQDNNVAAFRFYMKMGFEIGGFDNRIYRGTKQEDKANIILYLDK